MSVITIARQLGAGGGEVATLLAGSLGWRLLDRELVERIAAELNVEPEQVEAYDERVESFAERLGTYLSEGYPEMHPIPRLSPISPDFTARAARRILTGIVGEGPAVVVGHGAQCVLAEDPRAFHVFVHAPFELRAERAAARHELDLAAAGARLRQTDADRRRYVREHFDRDWLSPTLYHLCVDSGRIGVEATAEIIRVAADRYFGRTTAS